MGRGLYGRVGSGGRVVRHTRQGDQDNDQLTPHISTTTAQPQGHPRRRCAADDEPAVAVTGSRYTGGSPRLGQRRRGSINRLRS
jgi:hypothetical protein